MDKYFPVIETKRLLLDAISPKDKESIFSLYSDADVVEYYDMAAFTHLDQAEKIIAMFTSRYDENTGIRWAIRNKGDSKLLGTCGFNSYSFGHGAMIGYDLVKSHWGNGYASEAVAAICGFAFNGGLPVKVNRIEALTIPGNEASVRVLQKNGFVFEGLLRQKGFWKGRYHDMNMFSLLAKDADNLTNNNIL